MAIEGHRHLSAWHVTRKSDLNGRNKIILMALTWSFNRDCAGSTWFQLAQRFKPLEQSSGLNCLSRTSYALYPLMHCNTQLEMGLKPLKRGLNLGFMVAALSAGINHVKVQGISLGSLGEQVLKSANRVRHKWVIERNTGILDHFRQPSIPQSSLTVSSTTGLRFHEESRSPSNSMDAASPTPPRREYVWRTIHGGQQESLGTIAKQMAQDLEAQSSTLNRLVWTDTRNAHRCVGYAREEITLATTTVDSATVSHSAPSPTEICPICHEVVGFHEALRCICGDRTEFMCQICDWEQPVAIRDFLAAHDEVFYATFPDARPSQASDQAEAEHAAIYAPPHIKAVILADPYSPESMVGGGEFAYTDLNSWVFFPPVSSVFSHTSPCSFASPPSSAGTFASATSASFASPPSSAGANFNLNSARAYEELNPPPSAYSDSIPYGDAVFPPMHYPLDMASAYVPHLQLQQAPLLMHPYALQSQGQGQAPALLHGVHPPPGMQGPPLQLHPALYPVPAPTRRRERPRPEARPSRPPKRRIGYYPASPPASNLLLPYECETEVETKDADSPARSPADPDADSNLPWTQLD
ncbi:hypothetical protein B0H13DRAFT_2398864 [Mycena leptocephala]|nr:hypothetical protein B0H13DRAFT_2398864 [Mycena leptocephala]